MQRNVITPFLVKKYNQPVPRYTSYPTVPFWSDQIDVSCWQQTFLEKFSTANSKSGISLYIHLPFCESLCTYCGCNKKITKNHSVEDEYLDAVENEWQHYRSLMSEPPAIREIHLGGGTPTFFSAKNLERLMKILLERSTTHSQHEFSIEGHPNNTSQEQLQTLYGLGFRRISYGVQDLDPVVQKIINRIQPFENVQRATVNARATGFTSVNFDLIYGLPLQKLQSIENTVQKVISLKPDRVAFYSYAHVPWTSKVQRLFNEADLPNPDEKINLYLKGKELLMNHGYHDIGMDHFALAHDNLYVARQNGKLHRNFMGYTTQNTELLLGLGVSSISDLGNAFAQNEKTLHNYYAAVNEGSFAVNRGFFLKEEDLAYRNYIKDISCNGFTTFNPEHLPLLKEFSFPVLELLASDGLVKYDDNHLQLTPTGHYFIRNICAAFDLYLQRDKSLLNKTTFSKAI